MGLLKPSFTKKFQSYYTWNASAKKWNPRRNGRNVEGHPGIKFDCCIGRIFTVHPSQRECFYLRLLLTEIKGPTSFVDLRTLMVEFVPLTKKPV